MRIQSLSEQANRYTKAQLLLMECLQDRHIPYKSEYDIWADQPQNTEGFWFYRVDVYLPTKRAVLEVEGEGSHSKGNEVRDARIRSKDIEVCHIPNDMILKYGEELAAIIAALL